MRKMKIRMTKKIERAPARKMADSIRNSEKRLMRTKLTPLIKRQEARGRDAEKERFASG
jgi:hypothetical protein